MRSHYSINARKLLDSIPYAVLILVTAAALNACNSAKSSVPLTVASGGTTSGSGSKTAIAQAFGTSLVLFDAPLTDVAFIRYDVSPSMSYSYGFSVYDYDGDGKPDISYFDSYTSGRARLRSTAAAIGNMVWNNGDRQVTVASETFEFQTAPTNPAEFLLERQVPIDVDGDGHADIAGVSNSHDAVVAYINPGMHNAPWVRRVLSSVTPAPVNLTVADINGDGLPDIVVAMRYQPSSSNSTTQVGIAWLENTGKPTGEWIYHNIDTTAGNFADPRTVQAADINGDGKVEVVTTDSGTGVVAWYSQSAPDTWQRHVIPGVITFNSHFGRLVDMDGDGALDILLPVTQGVAWLRNVNNATSWEVHSIAQFTDPNWANVVTEVAAGDVHHDGSVDVAFSVGSLSGGVSTVHSGGVYLAHNNGSQWSVGRLYKTENSVVAIQLADFDGTGVPSVISNTEYQQNSITLWQNQLGLP